MNFDIQELVSPEVYADRGDRAWELLDSRAVDTLQALRNALGPITVNNWHVGGGYKESGLRSFGTATGAGYSQHKYGRAFDCKFKSVTPPDALAYIQANRDKFPHLTVVENTNATPTWLHFDCRYTGRPDIWIVNP